MYKGRRGSKVTAHCCSGLTCSDSCCRIPRFAWRRTGMAPGMSSHLQNYGEENKPPALTTLGFRPVNRCEPLLLSINLHYHQETCRSKEQPSCACGLSVCKYPHGWDAFPSILRCLSRVSVTVWWFQPTEIYSWETPNVRGSD
jgi:hypothetical protein